jgi:hypothetical protein
VGKANFVAVDLSVTARAKGTRRGYFGAHTLVGENGIFQTKISCSGQMYKKTRTTGLYYVTEIWAKPMCFLCVCMSSCYFCVISELMFILIQIASLLQFA